MVHLLRGKSVWCRLWCRLSWLQGKCGTGAGMLWVTLMNILTRTRTVLLFCQTTACSFSRRPLRPTPVHEPRYPHRPGSQINSVCLASSENVVRPMELIGLVQLRVASSILTEAQHRWWHSSASSFKCHQRSSIMNDTVEPSSLFETKLILKHVHS